MQLHDNGWVLANIKLFLRYCNINSKINYDYSTNNDLNVCKKSYVKRITIVAKR